MVRSGTVTATFLLGLAICLSASQLAAEPMTLDVVLSPKDEIRLDFKDGSEHFVVVRQGSVRHPAAVEGTATGGQRNG